MLLVFIAVGHVEIQPTLCRSLECATGVVGRRGVSGRHGGATLDACAQLLRIRPIGDWFPQ